MRREHLKLGPSIDTFASIEKSFHVALHVLVKESQRVGLRNVEVVEALVMVEF
jgi:hypothetical protein